MRVVPPPWPMHILECPAKSGWSARIRVPRLNNAITGIGEAAKSRTPMIVLTADTQSAAVRSNFKI